MLFNCFYNNITCKSGDFNKAMVSILEPDALEKLPGERSLKEKKWNQLLETLETVVFFTMRINTSIKIIKIKDEFINENFTIY